MENPSSSEAAFLNLPRGPFLRRQIQRCEKLIESYRQDIVRIDEKLAELRREIGELEN